MKDGIKIDDDKTQFWCNEKGQYHRLNNLPAVIYENGDNSYYINGTLHRTNGPALMWSCGNNIYYINGIENNPQRYTLWIYNKDKIQ